MDNRSNNISINITSGAILKVFAITALLVLLYAIRDLLLVVLTAIVIASAIEPLILFLKKYGMARVAAVIITYAVLVLILVGLFYFFLPPLLNDLSNFLATVPRYVDTVSLWNPLSSEKVAGSAQLVHGLSQGLSDSKTLVNTLSGSSAGALNTSGDTVSPNGLLPFSLLINDFRNAVSNFSNGFVQVLSVVFGGVLSFILIVVLSFYFAVQEDGIGSFLRIVTPVRQEHSVLDLWRRSQKKIGAWMQGQLLLGVLVGVLVYLGLTVLGIKNALLFGLVAAVFEIIPVFGPILASIPPVLTAFADTGLTGGLLVAGLFIIIQQFENHLIYPLVVKKIVGVPPILVILSLIIGAKLAGFLGILLSVPVASALMELLHDLEARKHTLAGVAGSPEHV